MSVAINHVCSNGAALRMCFHPLNALIDTLRGDDGVGIENDGKGATCLAYGLVVGFGKAHVVVVFHKPYVGKFGFHERHRVVGGMVVDHPNFALSALERFLGRTDGLLQEMLHAKTDYDDRNFQFLDVIS